MYNKNRINNVGFTLIELLVAMLVTTILSTAIFSAYQNQQKAHNAQQQAVEMQQTLRAAFYIMTDEIRMAGYNPNNIDGIGITKAGDGSNDGTNSFPLEFTTLANDDGIDNDDDCSVTTSPCPSGDSGLDESDELKTIAYDLFDSVDNDTANDDLGRKNGNRKDAIANNIQSLAFEYYDADMNVIPFVANTVPIARLPDIHLIRITITAIPEKPDQLTTTGRTLTTIVKCRNLGL